MPFEVELTEHDPVPAGCSKLISGARAIGTMLTACNSSCEAFHVEQHCGRNFAANGPSRMRRRHHAGVKLVSVTHGRQSYASPPAPAAFRFMDMSLIHKQAKGVQPVASEPDHAHPISPLL